MAMTATEFVARLVDIAENVPTLYGWGTFGQKITEQLIRDKTRQYPAYWTATHNAKFRARIGAAYSFDCVGLIKGIDWGWTRDGVRYRGSDVPDVSADGMIGLCQSVSGDMTSVPVGAFLWLPGHCGVYIGGGRVVEATPLWKDGVQITMLSQRRWEKWGLLPWVDYSTTETTREDTVSDWAKDAQAWAVENRISDGSNPRDPVTREQVWTMLYRMGKREG